jgi:hypothetical protein
MPPRVIKKKTNYHHPINGRQVHGTLRSGTPFTKSQPAKKLPREGRILVDKRGRNLKNCSSAAHPTIHDPTVIQAKASGTMF